MPDITRWIYQEKIVEKKFPFEKVHSMILETSAAILVWLDHLKCGW